MEKRRFPTQKVKMQLMALSGNKCAFPGCEESLITESGNTIGEIASIESMSPGAPRFNPSKTASELLDADNYILLCPNHHCLIDKEPEKYSIDWLRAAREQHLKNITKLLSKPESETKVTTSVSLSKAVEVWSSERENSSEEFWQNLFESCPQLISQAFPKSMYQLGSKCYVGGKSWTNTGGNLVDFIYLNRLTGNIVLVEIKTPKTKLLGKKYRNNAYSISEELSGSVVQVLNYKEQLMKELYQLKDDTFSAFNPKCVVIAGTLESEFKNETQYKSFELFRNNSAGVEVLTYDELFQKSKDTLAIAN
ncbi:Shedu immune nuclease family protein [Neptuniibacter sp. QD72_48]|uniref:Shedu immune nuclease family protein n=1 Tax=Neptuniibacter sp. QD72_48 TaxID=3398214 RepID=UPI0039F515E1